VFGQRRRRNIERWAREKDARYDRTNNWQTKRIENN